MPDRILIVKGDDTDFNDQHLVTLHLSTEFLDLSDFKASITLGNVVKKFDDLTSGTITLDYSSTETSTFNCGMMYGVLRLVSLSKKIATIESKIPFFIVNTVSGTAIATEPYEMTINVEQGGENILNIDIEAGISVSVGEIETLTPGSSAYVENVGTDNHLVLNFGIPRGADGEDGQSATITVGTTETLNPGESAYVENVGTENDAILNFGIPKGAQGQQGIPGQDGQDGTDGQDGADATINGYNAITLISGAGIDITHDGSEFVISGTGGVAEWGLITGNIENQTDLQDEFDTKQDVISDLSTIRSGSTLGSTSLQPSDILNSVESTATNKALSANMGKELQDQIDNLKARGRFLALWNCDTGLAMSNPPAGSYTYSTGDYFVVGVVASGSGTNYRPDGSTYTTGVASTTVETENVDVDDVYYYDGNVWRLQVNTQKTTTFSNIAGDPYDNTDLAAALNAKENTISDLSTIRSGASAGATAVQPADLADYAKKNVAQTFTAKQTFNANVDIEDGSALQSEGSDLIQRDDSSNEITIGNNSDALSLVGTATRPQYNNNDIALSADVPTVNNGTLTIQKNGTTIQTFTANSSSNVTANITAADSLTDIAVAGDNVTFETIPFGTLNITKVGNPSISPSFVASDFSDNNYFQTTDILNNATTSFEVVVPFKTPQSTTTNCSLIDKEQVSDRTSFRLEQKSNHIQCRLSSDPSGFNYFATLTGTTALVVNQKYWAKVTYDNTDGYKLFLSTDGENWNLEASTALTTMINQDLTTPLIIGDNSVPGYSFLGSIYLAGTYIKVNGGEYEWHAVNVTGEKQQINVSGPLPSQTGNSGKFLTTNGTTASWGNALANTATGTRSYAFAGAGSAQGTQSLSIGYNATTGVVNYAVAIGSSPTASNTYAIAIGSASMATGVDSIYIGSGNGTTTYQASGTEAISIGHYSKSTNERSIALGGFAAATANYAIQIGPGTNSTANSFSVATSISNNYTLLESDGTIPVGRYKSMTGADGVNAGTAGVVPAPTATDNTKFLRGDGTWATAGGGSQPTYNSSTNTVEF